MGPFDRSDVPPALIGLFDSETGTLVMVLTAIAVIGLLALTLVLRARR